MLATERGAGVRADYRCLSASRPQRYVWEQQLEGTPFARILRQSSLEIRLEADGEATAVTLTSREALRGLSRLGGPMMRQAAKRRLDEALSGIELALVERVA